MSKSPSLSALIRASGLRPVEIAAKAQVSERTVLRARDGDAVLPIVEAAIRAALLIPPPPSPERIVTP